MNSPSLTTHTTHIETTDAPPPYAHPRYTPLTALRQYQLLLRTLLASYRTDWFFHIFFGLLIPISLIFFARAIAGSVNSDMKIYLLGGNLAMSIAFGPTIFLIGKLGWARQNREFEYWIALPIPKLILVIAIISVSLLFSIPGLIGTYLLGTLALGLPWSGGWNLLYLVPLSVLSLSGLGALLGSISPNGQTSNVISNLLITFIGFLSPLMIPLQALPLPLQFISRFMPTTYIADAFRQALGAHTATPLSIDILILILTSILLLGLAQWKMDWRVP